MNVLIINPYISPDYGGTTKAVVELSKSLSNQGYLVDILTTNANTKGKIDTNLGEWINKEGYRIKYFNCYHKNDFIVSFSLVKCLLNYRLNYDVVHTNTMFSPMISLIHWICIFQKTAYIITPHGMLEPWALSYKAWKKRFYYALLEKPALQKSSAIQVLANTEAQNVKSLGLKTPTVVIPNGIYRKELERLPNSEIFHQRFPTTINKTLILFLGRLDPKKGLDLLAPAFAKVHCQFPQTHLVIAGPDNIGFLPTAKRYFTQAGCLDAVTFTGMLTGSLKYAALAAATLYVAPSYSEGFSMSVLEGMASGLPCIITTGCNFPEAAEAKAAHVVAIDSNAIADALIDCLNHPQQAKAMGTRAREFIFQNYTWEQAAKKLIRVYTAIIEKKPLPEDLTYSQ
jgi:glycosyltransferase involved in cell wall biosynthesis